MQKKYKNKYRVDTVRAKWWNYSDSGSYFITICTKNMEHFLGHIQHTTMCINEIGAIAHKEWWKTASLRVDMNIQLGQFIVMPNHVHGIISIGENIHNSILSDFSESKQTSHNKFGPQRKNLASIIRGFKATVTSKAKSINPNFKWQPSFHEHIIKNEKSFENISNYICNNPLNWKKDKFYTKT